MRNDRVTLDSQAVGLAAGTVTAVLFSLCALAVSVAPGLTAQAFSAMMHVDLTGIARPITWGSFIAGLICLSLGVGIVFATAAGLYNRFVRGFPWAARADVTAHRAA